MNWELLVFREDTESNLKVDVPLKSDSDIKKAIEQITKVIQHTGWNTTSKSAITNKYISYLPVDIKEKLAHKRRLRGLWQTSRSPVDKTSLNQATRELKVLLSDHKNRQIQNFLKNLSADANSN